jgi:hypothetical protein
MNVTVVARRDVFERAIATASQLGESESMPLPGFSAPLDHIRAFLNRAWAVIEEALRSAYLFGKEQAGELFETARQTVQQMIEQAADEAEELQAALLEKLRAYVSSMLSGTISLLPSEYQIGGRAYIMESISCTQKVMFSGSLKASLERVFELTSEGSLEIETCYSA